MNHDKENKASNRTLAGGADFSLQVFAPGTEGGFYHTHKEHEELYFFLSGEG